MNPTNRGAPTPPITIEGTGPAADRVQNIYNRFVSETT